MSLTSTVTAVDHTSTSAVFRVNYFIDRVTTDDSGIYTCNITNPLGTANTSIVVINASTYVLVNNVCMYISDIMVYYIPK